MSRGDLKVFKQQMEKELKENILIFWMDKMIDRENGGFYGRISNDLQVDKKAHKGLVLNTRILWTYAAAYRLYGNREYLMMADRAYDYIIRHFWDHEHGGAFWMVDYQGNPVDTKKQIYGEVFTIYGLAEYYRATGLENSRAYAASLYEALEKYAYDPMYKGYYEGFTREWAYAGNLMISHVEDPSSRKTMNTHLHLMEAYTNLLRVWEDPGLKNKLREIINVVMDHIVDQDTWHFKLFLDEKWHSLSDEISYGHDIEGSWLLMEAAEVLGDKDLLERAEETGLKMAWAALKEGVDQDGGMFYEANPEGIFNRGKYWWPQSEAVVGFLNAYQLTLKKQFLDAAISTWRFIDKYLVDKNHGEWFEVLKEGNVLPGPDAAKADPWKCPYHNGRACFEVIERVDRILMKY